MSIFLERNTKSHCFWQGVCLVNETLVYVDWGSRRAHSWLHRWPNRTLRKKFISLALIATPEQEVTVTASSTVRVRKIRFERRSTTVRACWQSLHVLQPSNLQHLVIAKHPWGREERTCENTRTRIPRFTIFRLKSIVCLIHCVLTYNPRTEARCAFPWKASVREIAFGSCLEHRPPKTTSKRHSCINRLG